MKAPRFRTWFARLSSLNQPQRRQVLRRPASAAGLDQVVAWIDQPGARALLLQLRTLHRHGFANDLQRLRPHLWPDLRL